MGYFSCDEKVTKFFFVALLLFLLLLDDYGDENVIVGVAKFKGYFKNLARGDRSNMQYVRYEAKTARTVIARTETNE